MENQTFNHPKANELNRLEEIKRQAKLENNKEKFDEANKQIKQIIKENEFQIPSNFNELPLETQKSIIQIKINESRVFNDTDAINYWTSIIQEIDNKINNKKDIKSKQEEKINQEENEIKETKEVIIAEKTNEDKEKSEKAKNEPQVIKGEHTTLIKDGNSTKLTSKYLDINISTNNQNLYSSLDKLLTEIALMDLETSSNNIDNTYKEVINNIKTEQDKKDVLEFAKSINIGKSGSNIALFLNSFVEINNNNKEIINENINNNTTKQVDDINKRKELLDMSFDDLQNNKTKDPDDFYQISGRYNKLMTDAESILKSLEGQDKYSMQIMIDEIQSKIRNIKNYAEMIEQTKNSLQK